MFSKPKAILYIHKNGISFYVDKDSAGLQFEYGDTVDGLLVKNADKLQAGLATFLKENFPDTYKVILLLSEEIVLEKSILTKSPDEQRIEIQKFLDDVPFKNVSKLLYKMSGILQVIATNRELYEAIASILSQYGWDVEAVTPIRIFGQFGTNNILSEDDIKDIFKKQSLLQEGNLLSESYDVSERSHHIEKETKHEAPPIDEPFSSAKPAMYHTKRSRFGGKSLVLGLIIALVFFGAGFFVLHTQSWKHVPGLAGLNPTPTLAPTATPSPSPTPVPLTKDKLQIQILNGTGKVGQAGIVKASLVKDGYINITTDNAPATNHTDATISFADSVSKTDQDTIKKDMEALFKTVTVSSDKVTGSNSVVITTGTQK